MGTKGQRREVNVFISNTCWRGGRAVARATTLPRGDREKQRGRRGHGEMGMAIWKQNQKHLKVGGWREEGSLGFCTPRWEMRGMG